MTSRMVSSQQANRRHEDKLQELEKHLNMERVRLRNKLWEDTHRIQQDLIQLHIRTPNTTHAASRNKTRRTDSRTGHSGLPLINVKSDQHQQRPLQLSRQKTSPLPLTHNSVLSKQKSNKSHEVHVQNFQYDTVCISGSESEEAMHSKETSEFHSDKDNSKAGDEICSNVSVKTLSNCHGQKRTDLEKQPQQPNTGGASPSLELQTSIEQAGWNEDHIEDSTFDMLSLTGVSSQISSVPEKESRKSDTKVVGVHSGELENITDSNNTVKKTMIETECDSKLDGTALCSKGDLETGKSKQPLGIRETQTTQKTEPLKDDVPNNQKASLLRLSNQHHVESSQAIEQSVLADEHQGKVHKNEDTLQITFQDRQESVSTPKRQIQQIPKCPHKTFLKHKQPLSIQLHLNQGTLRKPTGSVLPIVEVKGTSVLYHYQGVPGYSRTFKPNSKTHALLKKTNQIGLALNDLKRRQNSRLFQSFLKEEHENEEYTDGTSKERFEDLMRGWSPDEREKRKIVMKNRRKAKIRTVMTMKCMLTNRPATVPEDLEDSSLSGKRLLKLYKIWSNARKQPVWTTSSYLQRKHEEATHHQSRQGQTKVVDLHTTVLQAMTVGLGRKQESIQDLAFDVDSAWKTIKSLSFSSKLASMTIPQMTNEKEDAMTHGGDSVSANNANFSFFHLSSSRNRTKKGLFRSSTRLIPSAAQARAREPIIHGRKIVLGRELKMSVGNMSLSTGLTGTVAKAKRHPDVFVRNDD